MTKKVLNEDMSDLEFLAEVCLALSRSLNVKDALVGLLNERYEVESPDIPPATDVVGAIAIIISQCPEMKMEFIEVINATLSTDNGEYAESEDEIESKANTSLELQTKEELEAWIKEEYGFNSVEIISGLGDTPRISSPRDFKRELVKVHKENKDCILGELACARAKEQGSLFGLRDAIVCRQKREEILREWYPFFIHFTETVVKINGDLCVAFLHPRASDCDLCFDKLGRVWRDFCRFPVSRKSL